MNRDEVKKEVASIIWHEFYHQTYDEDVPTPDFDSEAIAEKVLSFLDDIGYDSYPETHPNLHDFDGLEQYP